MALRVSFDYLLLPNDAERTLAPRFVTHLPVADPADRKRCQLCLSNLRYGEPHMDGECMRKMDESGFDRVYIANIWGYTVESIDAILAEEYRRAGHDYNRAISNRAGREKL